MVTLHSQKCSGKYRLGLMGSWSVLMFRYFGDMIGAGGGAEEASRARVRCAWAMFRELALVLTSRGASLKVKGNIEQV